MGPTLSIKPAPEPPALPVARLHGRGVAMARAQRSAFAGLLVVLAWLLPVVALALTIALTT